MSRVQTMVVTTLLSAAVVGAASAQAPQAQLEITPLVGGTLFLSELPRTFELTTANGAATSLVDVVIADAFTLGGRAALRLGDRLGIGATVLYAPTTATASGIADTDVGLWAFGLDLSYHALTRAAPARPFVVAGVGGKTYDFDGMDPRTDFMWNVGAGLDLRLHPLAALRLEARDYMSLFASGSTSDDELQHDLALTAGISFTPGGRRR
jgi:hypothetical protein